MRLNNTNITTSLTQLGLVTQRGLTTELQYELTITIRPNSGLDCAQCRERQGRSLISRQNPQIRLTESAAVCASQEPGEGGGKMY